MMQMKEEVFNCVPTSTAVLYRGTHGVFDDPVRSHPGKCHKVPSEDTSDGITGVF